MFWAPTPADPTKPYKILISLLDRGDMGLPILQAVTLDAYTSLFRAHAAAVDAARDDAMAALLQAANMLFDMCDPFFLWAPLQALVRQYVPTRRQAAPSQASTPYAASYCTHTQEVRCCLLPVYLSTAFHRVPLGRRLDPFRIAAFKVV